MNGIDKITDEQWAEYLVRLTSHAARQFQKRGWGSATKGRGGPDGNTPDDIAQEVIRRVIEGERRYNPDVYETFLYFLYGAGNSLISHLADRAKSRKSISLSQLSTDEDAQSKEIEYASTIPDPLEESLSQEVRDKIEAVVLCHFANDPIVLGLLDCFEAGITKRSEIAECLNVDPKEIDSARKRLRRKLETELSF